MTKTITLLLAMAIVAGSIAFLRRPVTHASEKSGSAGVATCGDQYNALVLMAKQSLTRNDRSAAIRMLVEARTQLQHCEELHAHDVEEPGALALNSF